MSVKSNSKSYRSYNKLSANVAGFIMPLHRCISASQLVPFIGQPKQWQLQK